MKTYIVIIIVLALLLSLTLLCGCMKSEVKAYEGFREGATEDDAEKDNESEEGPEEEEKPEENKEEKKAEEKKAEEKKADEKKEGFTGLSYADINNTKQIDSFSAVNGSFNCLSGSMNLTNSMGPLCLSQEQQMSLQTRGGNASCPNM